MILNKYVQEIVDNSVYLTPENIALLRSVLPEVQEILPLSEKSIDLRALVSKMMQSLEIQAAKVTSSEDPRDHKLIVDGYDKLIKMLVKHNESIDLQERSQAIEEALISALDYTAEQHNIPELKTTFLQKLGETK